jgi:hemerythrin-like domain-containing protein
MTNPITVLRKEHDVIVRMLGVAETIAHRLSRGESVAPETLFGLQEFFVTYADTCHHGKEEGLLFPVLEKKGVAKNGGPLGIMLMEHDESREFVQQMKQAAADYAAGKVKAGDRWAVAASSYSEILRQHIFKENNVLFCMAERMLSDVEQAEMAAAFDKVESETLGASTRERLHVLMEKLMAEVMPKAS